jgi:phospholipid-binding lipoprotein MlaA
LCARGVPAGPYIVFPLLGGRTLRDGVTDLLVANLLVYLASIPFLGPVPSIELLIAVEVLDSVPAWLIARELDSVGAAEPQGMAMEAAREGYLRARAEACAALRAPWSVNDGARVDNAGQPVLQR